MIVGMLVWRCLLDIQMEISSRQLDMSWEFSGEIQDSMKGMKLGKGLTDEVLPSDAQRSPESTLMTLRNPSASTEGDRS